MPRTTFYGRRKIPVTLQPNIGLDADARESVTQILNLMLADETVLSFKTHIMEGLADWPLGSSLKTLSEAQSKQINEIIVEISERVMILGGAPVNDSEILIDTARIDGNLAITPGVIHILADQEAFIRLLREDAQKCSELYGDQGTFTLLIDILRMHEKMAWTLRSNITEAQFDAVNSGVDQ